MSLQQTTPETITSKIEGYCRSLDLPLPFFVTVKGVGETGRCYINCADYVNAHLGSRIVYGFMVWESSFILELEAHAIIQEADGSYLDVTITPDGEETVLFTPSDKYVPTFRIALVRGLTILEVTSTANLIYPAKGARRHVGGIDLASEGLSVVEALTRFKVLGVIPLPLKEPFVVKPNNFCSCGSGLRFKKCCMNKGASC